MDYDLATNTCLRKHPHAFRTPATSRRFACRRKRKRVPVPQNRFGRRVRPLACLPRRRPKGPGLCRSHQLRRGGCDRRATMPTARKRGQVNREARPGSFHRVSARESPSPGPTRTRASGGELPASRTARPRACRRSRCRPDVPWATDRRTIGCRPETFIFIVRVDCAIFSEEAGTAGVAAAIACEPRPRGRRMPPSRLSEPLRGQRSEP